MKLVSLLMVCAAATAPGGALGGCGDAEPSPPEQAEVAKTLVPTVAADTQAPPPKPDTPAAPLDSAALGERSISNLLSCIGRIRSDIAWQRSRLSGMGSELDAMRELAEIRRRSDDCMRRSMIEVAAYGRDYLDVGRMMDLCTPRLAAANERAEQAGRRFDEAVLLFDPRTAGLEDLQRLIHVSAGHVDEMLAAKDEHHAGLEQCIRESAEAATRARELDREAREVLRECVSLVRRAVDDGRPLLALADSTADADDASARQIRQLVGEHLVVTRQGANCLLGALAHVSERENAVPLRPGASEGCRDQLRTALLRVGDAGTAVDRAVGRIDSAEGIGVRDFLDVVREYHAALDQLSRRTRSCVDME